MRLRSGRGPRLGGPDAAPRRARAGHRGRSPRCRMITVRWVRARLALVVFACACACRPALKQEVPAETEARRKLGVPDDAARVLILSQSSHLDIDWRHTFDDYHRLYVDRI